MEYEKIKDNLLAEIDSGLKYAQTLDKSAEFEIYLSYRSNSEVVIKQGVVEATDGTTAGTSIRATKDQRVSFTSASGIASERIKRCLQEAVAILNATSEKDTRFQGFSEPKPSGREGKFTPAILEQSTEDLVKHSLQIIGDISKVNRRMMAVASCEVSWGGFAIGNTRGLQQASSSAYNYASAYAMAIDDNERRANEVEFISREKAIDPTGMGEKAARKALSLLGAKKLNQTAMLPTLWMPKAAASYIYASLGQSAVGHNVVEGLSPLANQIGDKIADTRLTVLDNGQDPQGIATEAVDAEGHPHGRTTLINQGVLKSFLFDSYYGRIAGKSSTGNCGRAGGPFGGTIPYEQPPKISTTNLEVIPGSKSAEDLMAALDGQGLLITDTPIGIFHSNVSTGEFSVVANSVFLIEDGEKKTPLEPLSVAGSFYKGYEQLRGIGNNVEMTSLFVKAPSFLIDGFSVTG